MTVNTLGSPHASRPSRTVAEWLWPFLPMGLAAFSLSALVYYHLRQNVFEVRSPLQQLFAGFYRMVGFAPAVMFCGLVIVWSTIWLAVGRLDRPLARLFRLVAMAVMLGVFLNLGDGGVSPALHKGALGAWLAETLVGAFGYWPSLLLVWAITFASLLLATDFFFHESFERLRVPEKGKEAGVEAAVTDHLRGLMQEVQKPSATPLAGRPGPEPTSAFVPAAAVTEVPEVIDTATGLDADGPVPAGPPAPRRSYFERRAERQARSWRRPDDEDLAAPVSDAADDVPAGVAAETRPADAAAVGDDAPAASDDAPAAGAEPVVPPGDDLAFTDDGWAAGAAAAAPAAGVAPELAAAASRHEPIVFPDEVPPTAGSQPDGEPDAAGDDAPAAAGAADDAGDADTADAASDAEVDAAASEEPIVAIPRPEPLPVASIREPEAPVDEVSPARQQQLFGAQLDEALVQEAIELVTGSRRATVAFLQRKLRIDYELASEVLSELAARGIVALDGDATQGRVLG